MDVAQETLARLADGLVAVALAHARRREGVAPEPPRGGPAPRRPVVTGIAAPFVRPRVVGRVGWVDGGLGLVGGHGPSVALGAPGGERGTP
jgi:hypothetical protein